MRSYYNDLTYYSCHYFENAKNIGWIEETGFNKGNVSKEFIENLYKYIKRPIHIVRDCFYSLDMTYKNEILSLGFLEIRVLSEDGKQRYASPDLIFHYIVELGYKPPQEFIDAVLYGPKPGSVGYENFMNRYKEEYLLGESEETVRLAEKLTNIIYEDNMGKLKEIIEKRKDILDIVTKEGSLLNVAIKAHNIDIVKYLLSEGIDINKFSGEELNTAVREMENEIVKLLLSRNIMIDTRTYLSNPLFTAVIINNYGATKLLLDIGIDKNIAYSNEFMRNKTVVKLAENEVRSEIKKLLEKY